MENAAGCRQLWADAGQAGKDVMRKWKKKGKGLSFLDIFGSTRPPPPLRRCVESRQRLLLKSEGSFQF